MKATVYKLHENNHSDAWIGDNMVNVFASLILKDFLPKNRRVIICDTNFAQVAADLSKMIEENGMGEGELDDDPVFRVLKKYFNSISKPNPDDFIESIFCAMMHERKRLVNFRVAEVVKPIDCIIIPVNVGQHWTLAWVNFQDGSINYSAF